VSVVETELLQKTTNEQIITDYKAWKATMNGPLLKPEDVADSCVFAFEMPQRACGVCWCFLSMLWCSSRVVGVFLVVGSSLT
jgi:hypothetical protein